VDDWPAEADVRNLQNPPPTPPAAPPPPSRPQLAAPAAAAKREPKQPTKREQAECNAPLRVGKGREDFGDVLTQSYLFYEAQQSGPLPDWNRLRADKPCGWRQDAHLDEGKAIGKDLVGGYYDAGGEGLEPRRRRRRRGVFSRPAGAARRTLKAASRVPSPTQPPHEQPNNQTPQTT
jgi:hypothetical protein